MSVATMVESNKSTVTCVKSLDNNNNNNNCTEKEKKEEEKSLFPSIEIPSTVLPWNKKKGSQTNKPIIQRFKRKKGNLDQLLANVEAKKRREEKLQYEKEIEDVQSNKKEILLHNRSVIDERGTSLTKWLQDQTNTCKSKDLPPRVTYSSNNILENRTIFQRKDVEHDHHRKSYDDSFDHRRKSVESAFRKHEPRRKDVVLTEEKTRILYNETQKHSMENSRHIPRPYSAFRPIMTMSNRQEYAQSSYTSHTSLPKTSKYAVSVVNPSESDLHHPGIYRHKNNEMSEMPPKYIETNKMSSISTESDTTRAKDKPLFQVEHGDKVDQVRYVFESNQSSFKEQKRKANKRTLSANERYSKLSNSQLQRRLVANARERSRVHALSTAFNSLRVAIPSYSTEQKLSKLTILRVAINYINALDDVLQQDVEYCGTTPEFARYVDECSSVLQTEYGRSKSKHGIE